MYSWRRSKCSNLGGIPPKKFSRATLTAGLACERILRVCFTLKLGWGLLDQYLRIQVNS